MIPVLQEFRKGLVRQFSPAVAVRQCLESLTSSVVSGATKGWAFLFLFLWSFMRYLPMDQFSLLQHGGLGAVGLLPWQLRAPVSVFQERGRRCLTFTT